MRDPQAMSANQRFTLCMAGIAVLGIALLREAPAQQPVPIGSKVPEVVNARQFQVVDKNGKIRVALGLVGENDETAYVRLWNSRTRVTTELRADPEKSRVILAGPDGKHEAILVGSSDGPGLIFGTNRGEQPRLHLLVDEDGQPQVRLFNKAGFPRGAQVKLEPMTP